MNKPIFALLALAGMAQAGVDIREKATISQDDTTTLYQVGENGEYCVSLTPDTSGCVSGIDDAGSTVNLLDLVKGKYVVFQNLSDAPHDMKFTGQNQDELPPQDPGDTPVEKKMTVEDLQNQKINCSFHGDMLAVGYRVPGDGDEEVIVVGKDEHMAKRVALEKTENAPPRPLTTTALANVSKEILQKGSAAVVEKLVANKPELMNSLAGVRPLLAKELQAKGIGVNGPTGALAQGNGQTAGALFDTGAPRPGDKKAPGGNGTGPGTTLKEMKMMAANGNTFRAAIGDAKTLKELAARSGGRDGQGRGDLGRGGSGRGQGADGSDSSSVAAADDAALDAAFQSLAGQSYDGKGGDPRVASRGPASEGGGGGSGREYDGGGFDPGRDLSPEVKTALRLVMGIVGLGIFMIAFFMRRKKKEPVRK